MMKWLIPLLLAFPVFGDEVATLPVELQEKVVALNARYLQFVPETKPKAKLPLLIYLHGSGGRGDQVERIGGQTRALREGLRKFGKDPCIVVAPQCLKETKKGERAIWEAKDLDVLLQHLTQTLPVDTKRIYLTGNSMGGYGCFVWGGTSPQHFAAIAPVVGGIGPGGPKDVTPELDAWAANLAKVPLWAFAGAKDRVVPAERSERMVAAIKKAGGTRVKITVYPEEGHGARGKVYADKAFYDWMFGQRRE